MLALASVLVDCCLLVRSRSEWVLHMDVVDYRNS